MYFTDQCGCKAAMKLVNYRSDKTATVDGRVVTIHAGIYVYQVEQSVHSCEFGPLGGRASKAIGRDGLPLYT
jgi:hypothetical protein